MRIQQISDTEWQILDDADNPAGDTLGSYAEAVAFLGGMMAYAATLAADDSDEGAGSADGLLPEAWEDVAGICFPDDTGDGRSFLRCEWSARDPKVSLMPLMLQTTTEMGHFGAELAGFIETITDLGAGTTPKSSGRFYDSECGRQFRDLLLDGRQFGVSVDPGRLDVEWVCVESDEDGWCIQETADFLAYEIIGLTGTPFPAFEAAAIQLAGATSSTATADDAVAAAASRRRTRPSAEASVDRNHPPIEWLRTAEPRLGEPFAFGDLGDEWLVEQTDDGRLAMPLTILDSGRFAGHLAYWGQCHIAWPGGPEVCVTPPRSEAAYSKFHVGDTVCADGTHLPTGVMTASCDHALRGLRAPEARDSYAHNGMGWGRARVANGQFGPWCSGVLHPDVTADQLAVLRGGTLSGDWRFDEDFGGLQLIASLAVNHGGFPIAREAITASGWNVPTVTRPQVQVQDGRVVTLIASGLVRRCPDCAKRAAARRMARDDFAPLAAGMQAMMARMDRRLAELDRRTRHLVAPAAEYAAARIRNGN